ncbi:MAG: 3-hydroxybutyryl-CoA dehydrogenase [Bacteroidetes bacterium]|nr:3-hydroxybutyryl-CoA dehydrogenase [Bacteroidota bacterium]
MRITRVGVVGAGSMGQGIAQVCAAAGYSVLFYDLNSKMVEQGIDSIIRHLDQAVAKGKSTKAQKEKTLQHIEVVPFEKIQADLVMEAVVEKLEVKQKLFSELEKINSSETILASNTSSLSISQIAAELKHPERFLGLHFFNPAHLMKLVEVVAGEKTESGVVLQGIEFTQSIGKIPVRVKDSPGFIVNRVARHYYLEALKLLEENTADMETIDALAKSAGFKLGPFELMDLIGNDVNLEVSRLMYQAFGFTPRFKPNPIQEEKVRTGQLGKKTGRGYYTYTTDK